MAIGSGVSTVNWSQSGGNGLQVAGFAEKGKQLLTVSGQFEFILENARSHPLWNLVYSSAMVKFLASNLNG